MNGLICSKLRKTSLRGTVWAMAITVSRDAGTPTSSSFLTDAASRLRSRWGIDAYLFSCSTI